MNKPREIKNHGPQIYIERAEGEPSITIMQDERSGVDRIWVGTRSAPLVDVETLIAAWKLRQKDGRQSCHIIIP